MNSKNVSKTDKTRRNRGFTLIEVLIAMMILSVGLLATTALSAGIIRANRSSNHLTTATNLARDKMEEVQSLEYSKVTDETEDYGSISYYPFYKRVTDISTDGNPAPDMKTVSVTVYWNNDNRWVALDMIVAE